MVDPVKTAVYAMGLDPAAYVKATQEASRANEQLIASTAKVTVEEEKLERAARTSADTLTRLDARVDAAVRAEQRRAAALATVARAVQEGQATQERAAQTIARVNAFYDAQVAAATRARAAVTQMNAANVNIATAATRGAGAIQLQGYQIANLGQQIQDVAVQLGSGQNPFIILLQQGPQAAYAVGGVAASFQLLKQAILGNPILTIGAVIGTAAVAMLAFSDDTVSAAEAQKVYAEALDKSNELLLTSAERSNKAAEAKEREARAAVNAAIRLKELQLAQINTRLEAEGLATGFAAGPGAEAPTNARLRGQAEQIEQELTILRQQQQQLIAGGSTAEEYAKITAELDPLTKATREYNAALVAVVEARMAERISQEEATQRFREIENRYTKEKEKIDGTTDALKARLQVEAQFWAENDRAAQQGVEALQRLEEKRRKQAQSLEAYIGKLESEARLAAETNELREIGRAIREAELKLTDELGRKTRELTDEERRRIEAAVRERMEREAAAKAAEKAEQERQRRIEKYAQEVKQQTDRILDNIADAAGDILFDYLEGRSGSFWETFLRLGKRAFANLVAEAATQQFLRPIVNSVVGSMPSLFGIQAPAAQQSGGGILGGVGGLGGGSPFSLLSSAFDVPGMLGLSGTGAAGAGAAGGLGSLSGGLGFGGLGSGMGFLGAGGIGLGIGGLIGSFSPFGKTGYGGMIGGGIGGLAGFALGGPIGAVVGSVLGGLGGSLFGPGKSVGPGANANLVLTNGQFGVGASAADNGGNVQQAIQTTQQLAQALNAFVSASGLRTAGSGFQLDAGYFKDQLFLGAGGGPGVNTLLQTGDPDALAMAAFRQLYGRGNIYGATGSAATVLGRSNATTLTGLASDIDLAKTIDRLNGTLNPLDEALAAINQQFSGMVTRAKELGLAYDVLEREQQKQVDLAKAQFAGGGDPANDAGIIQGIGGVRSLVQQLSFGAFSPLSSAEQFQRAERELNAVGGAAAAGDLASLNAFSGTASTFINMARERYASSPQFFDAVNKVLGFAGQIGDVSAEGWRAQVNATNQQTVTLVGELQALRNEVSQLRREVRQGNMQEAFAA
jgi:hypothetical protein